MKLLKILTIISALVLSSFCFAEQEEKETPSAPAAVTPIKEIQVEGLNFEELSKEESKIGSLAEHVKDKNLSLESFLDAIRTHLILHPYAEGLAYVNGQLCHVGNYPQSVIYTVLEGPYYGLQTTTDYNGFILYVNPDYVIEYTLFGVVLHHYYSDSEVVTGSNQVIMFY
jgi:hypothetical protein